MVIINFANKWEIIIIIRDKKNRDKFFVRWKKIGEKYWSGKRKLGKSFVGEKFTHLQKIESFFPDSFFPDKVEIRHFRPKLVNWNETVYCTPIDRALKMWFNEGSGSFLRSTIPELWRFLWNQLGRFLDKVNTHIYKNFQQFFVTNQGFLISKKYKKYCFE